MTLLVDSHCHLDFSDFMGDLDIVMQRAADAGIESLQTICTKLSEFESTLRIAEKYSNVWCSVGIHPHHVDEEKACTVNDLISRANNSPKVIGVGETGLDFYYDNSDRKKQEASFRTHIEAARLCELPIIIHTRNADEETCRILSEEMAKGKFSGVIHCFSAGHKVAKTALELGLYISLSGIITFKSANNVRNIVRDIPIDNLLVETDAPFLAPVPYRGGRNEPAFVKTTAAYISEFKQVPFDELATKTTKNFYTLFSKAKKPIQKKSV